MPFLFQIPVSVRGDIFSCPTFSPTELPVLLPYKPHGSEEMFYVPQTEADVSTERSDTTMESSHPGQTETCTVMHGGSIGMKSENIKAR